MYGSSGCLGCDAKHKLMKSQESQTLPASRPCMAEGVWTTSRCDVDNGAVPSLGTTSSIDTPNPTLDSHGTRNTSQDFINHGFLFWNQSRQQWIGSNEKSNQGDLLRESRLSWNETYVSLLGSNKPFATPVPLSIFWWMFGSRKECMIEKAKQRKAARIYRPRHLPGKRC